MGWTLLYNPLENASLLDLLDDFGTRDLTPLDRLKVLKLKALVFLKNKMYGAAIDIYRSLPFDQLDDASAIHYSSALEGVGKIDDAIDVLAGAARRLDDNNLYHHLASLCARSGHVEEALFIYEDRLNQINSTRQYLVEYARILKAIGDTVSLRKMRTVCEKVLAAGAFPAFARDAGAPSPEDFYTGFANYLLGKHDLAKYDYDRSFGFCDKYYNEIDL